MNNKGQTLVIFVIMLPVLILIFTLIVDYGLLSIEKRKISNNTYDALEYYLDNITDTNIKEKTIKLLKNNLKNIEISIIDNNELIEIEVKSDYKSLYNTFTHSSISIKYKGNKNSKEIIKG